MLHVLNGMASFKYKQLLGIPVRILLKCMVTHLGSSNMLLGTELLRVLQTSGGSDFDISTGCCQEVSCTFSI